MAENVEADIQSLEEPAADQEEDDIIFEMNEEFSLLIDQSPQWFSFEDLQRCKMKENTFKHSEIMGYLEVKQNKTINPTTSHTNP